MEVKEKPFGLKTKNTLNEKPLIRAVFYALLVDFSEF